MSNTTTSGFLAPLPAPEPLEGQALLRFIQQWVVGVTGLPGPMVRPRWQPEPPNIPSSGTAWAAIGITTRPSDTFPFAGMIGKQYTLQRHELLNVLSSFYGLGAEGPADGYAALLRDGAAIPQNREVLTRSNFNLIELGEPVAVPSLLKKRWLYRVDMNVVLRREIERVYPVEPLATAGIRLNGTEIIVNPPES